MLTIAWPYTLPVADSPRVTAAAVVCTPVVVCITDDVYYIGHELEAGVGLHSSTSQLNLSRV